MGIVFSDASIGLENRANHVDLFAHSEIHFTQRHTLQETLSHSECHCLQRRVARPVPFPCFGDWKKEKYVLLPSVADIVVEQGYLQSLCGVYSIRIENDGVRSPSDDLQIQGIADALDFRKAVVTQLSNLRSKSFSRQASAVDDTSNLTIGHSCTTSMSPSRSIRHDSLSHCGDLVVLQKLEEVGSAVKRVQNLIEEHHLQKSEFAA